MTSPTPTVGFGTKTGVSKSEDLDMSPGAPRWYVNRLCQKLMSRQPRYRKLEAYALGNHPYPVGDPRFVLELQNLQRKSRTNYIELVIKAVTNRMRVQDFSFDGESDDDAAAIWSYNNMDLFSGVIINTAATFGDAYALVSPPDPDDPNGEPVITPEEPKMCITEDDPRYPSKTLAGFKMWQDDVDQVIYACLYLPGKNYLYEGPALNDVIGMDSATLTKRLTSTPSEGGFKFKSVEDTGIDKVTLVRGNWQPAFGSMGRGEAESAFDIQDRINHTILDRLVIAKSQAYNQRWVSGATKDLAGQGGRPPFRAGADAVWALPSVDGKFGQFDAADLTQMLQAIRDDVGDLAAITETPASFLMNRMVNVSGDTLTQDQSALVQKVKWRMDAMGWMFERVMRLCFLFKGDEAKATSVDVETNWVDPEIRALSEQADAATKLVTAGVPWEVIGKLLNFSKADIELIAQKVEEQKQLEADQMQAQLDAAGQQATAQAGHEAGLNQANNDHALKLAKTNNDAKLQQTKVAAAAKPKPKPSAGKK